VIQLVLPGRPWRVSSKKARAIWIATRAFLPSLWIAILLPLRAEGIPAPQGSFIRRQITVIPYGADSSSFPPLAPCGEEDCTPAFGFTGPDGSIYVYDRGNRNLKHVTLSTESVSVAVISGPAINTFPETPSRGAATMEGSLYLLSDSQEGFQLDAREPGGQWAHEGFSRTAVAAIWPSDQQGRPLPAGGARISAEGDTAVFFAADRRRYPATTIAARGHLIAESKRRILPSGVPLEVSGKEVARLVGPSIERADGTTKPFPFKTGTFLGVDRQGRSYFIVERPAPPPSSPSSRVSYIEAYDEAGVLLARVDRTYAEEGRYVGNEFLVTPSDGVIVLRFSKKGLAVSQLVVEEKQ
jgi:hypothetical protein